MRLSHRDFRPKKRRKYVLPGSVEDRSGPSRKRLTLRILLLAAFGILVYLKYDDFIQSPLIKRLREPQQLWKDAVRNFREPAVREPATALPQISPDSVFMLWSCASAKSDSCLDAWAGMDAGDKGSIRALLWKARLRMKLPEPSSFAAGFRGNPAAVPETGTAQDSASEAAEAAGEAPARPWRLDRIRFQAGPGSLDLESLRDSAGGERWCLRSTPPTADPDILLEGRSAATLTCLDEPRPKPPLRLFSDPELHPERPPVLSFRTGSGEAFHPILPGKVMGLPSGEKGWLKVYHGRNLFSYYSGFAGIGKDLDPGALVGVGDTLGFAGDADTAAAMPGGAARTGTLRLRIEKDGSPIDPLAFLGLEPAPVSDSAVTHAR